MTTDARVVSNYLVDLAQEDDGNTLTPMQALKLVYIAHGYSLGFRRIPLIYNTIEAWKFGPVIPDLYHALKKWRNQPIMKVDVSYFRELAVADREFVKMVYESYKDFDGIALSALTHQAGTPWALEYSPQRANVQISNDLIEHHYREMIAA